VVKVLRRCHQIRCIDACNPTTFARHVLGKRSGSVEVRARPGEMALARFPALFAWLEEIYTDADGRQIPLVAPRRRYRSHHRRYSFEYAYA